MSTLGSPKLRGCCDRVDGLCVDFYEENQASTGGSDDLGVPMTLWSKTKWQSAFKAAGLTVVHQERLRAAPGTDGGSWKETHGSLMTVGEKALTGRPRNSRMGLSVTSRDDRCFGAVHRDVVHHGSEFCSTPPLEELHARIHSHRRSGADQPGCIPALAGDDDPKRFSIGFSTGIRPDMAGLGPPSCRTARSTRPTPRLPAWPTAPTS